VHIAICVFTKLCACSFIVIVTQLTLLLCTVIAATAVAWELFQIFTTQGCPLILQHDNGKEFCNKVIKRLKDLYPDCVIVRGRPRHPQTQGSVERGNQDIHYLVGNWMKRFDSSAWSVGIYIVAQQKNDRYHRLISKSPYVLLYGQKPRVKMNELPNDLDLCKKLQTEGELEELMGVDNLVKGYKEKDDVEFIDEEPDDEEVLISGLQKSVILKAVLPGNVDNTFGIVF